MGIIHYLIIILLTPILLLLNFRLLVFSQNFYKTEFEKLNVYENFQSRDIVDFEMRNLINYYCCDNQLNESFYTREEILHLADVKQFITLTNTYLYALLYLLAVCIIYMIHKRQYNFSLNNINLAATVTIVCIATLWLLSKMHFEEFFARFHAVTFNNNYWLLSKDSNLVKLFPAQFYVDFANQVALQTLAMAIAIILFVKIVKRANASQKH